MLLHGKFVLLLVGSVTCLCTLSSVKYLSTIIAAQQSSAREPADWRSIIDRAETNIGSHLPQFLRDDGGGDALPAVLPSGGEAAMLPPNRDQQQPTPIRSSSMADSACEALPHTE